MSCNRWTLKFWLAVVTIAIWAGLTALVPGQEKPENPEKSNEHQPVHLIDDWSTHHSIFTNVGTYDQAMRNHTFVQWYKLQKNTRYQFFLLQHSTARLHGAGGANLAPTTDFTGSRNWSSRSPEVREVEDSRGAISAAGDVAESSNLSARTVNDATKPAPTKTKPAKPSGDWSNYLGGTTSAGLGATMNPIKYSFDINAAPECNYTSSSDPGDFLVVPINQAPKNPSSTKATGTITINFEPAAGNTVTVGSDTYTFETTCSIANCVVRSSSTSTEASNLAAALGGSCGSGSTSCQDDTVVSASASAGSNVVNLTATTGGAGGNSIALSSSSSFRISVSGTTLTGGTSVDAQSSIVAFNNLYNSGAIAASQIGTVTSNGAISSSSVTIGPGGGLVNPVTLDASPPVTATGSGAFSSPPLASSSITVVNGSNTLTLKTNATASTATGTFSGTPTTATTVTITSGANTLTLTGANAPPGTGTVTISSTSISGDTIKIGGTTYTWVTSLTAANQILQGSGSGTTGHDNNAENLEAAINANAAQCSNAPSACFGTGTVAQSGISATVSGAVVTVTNATGSAVTWSVTGSGETLSPTGSIPATSGSGANSCTSATTGTFGVSATTTTSASNLETAINACNTSYSAVGATATLSGSSVIVSNTTLGDLTISNFAVGGSGLPASVFSWGSVTAGSDGSNGCTGSTTATYMTSSSTSTLASNLSAAINDCTSGTGVTSSASGSTVDLTALTTGSGGNSITLTPTATGFFKWAAGTLTGGSDGSTSATTFAYWSVNAPVSTTTLASNIATAITLSAAGFTGTSSGNVVTIVDNTTGPAGDNVALSSGLTGFTWDGAYPVGGEAAGPCTSGPTVMWAYNSSTAATAAPMLGSPILSLDGTKVAFIESATTGAILHVLRWNYGDGVTGGTFSSTLAVPTNSTTSSAWTTCLAGSTACMFSLQLGSNNNTNSPPFYDYAPDDTLYVGDNGGRLWQVTGVFNGTPTIVGGAWASGVAVDTSSAVLTGPNIDFATGNILVADSLGKLSTVTPSGSVTSVTVGGAITDAPIVDSSTTGYVYVFSGGNASNSVVYENNTLLTGPAKTVAVGYNSPGTHVHAGAFDNLYFNNSGTGNMYVCGKQSGNSAPALYQLPISSLVLTGAVNGPLNLSTNTTGQECSPLTELFNPNQGASGVDWLFLGVPANCAFGGSSSGCIMSFDITSGTMPAGAFATGLEYGGTSGIVVDNVSPTGTATSNTFFTTLGAPTTGSVCANEPSTDNSNCVVARSQAGLF
jgi:hypothetical protein